jgi:hypothetical protein
MHINCYCCRLASFLDQWPHLEKWFDQFEILRHVDASEAKETVIMETELIVEQTIQKVRKNCQYVTFTDVCVFVRKHFIFLQF